MSPRYRAREHNARHARPVEPVPAKGPKPRAGQRQCAVCGRWLNNPQRAHRTTDDAPCREPAPVKLDELPPVIMPDPRTRSASASPRPPKPKDAPPGVREWGTCETCGKTVTGERRFCGLCLARRMERRR